MCQVPEAGFLRGGGTAPLCEVKGGRLEGAGLEGPGHLGLRALQVEWFHSEGSASP